MTDIFTKEKRSLIMSKIRSTGTKIEKIMEAELTKRNLKFEKHAKDVFGNPDFVIRRKKIAIFCDSEFWHGYRMGEKKLSKLPTFWKEKIIKNKLRDKSVNKNLVKQGWTVLRFLERDIEHNLENCINKILKASKAK